MSAGACRSLAEALAAEAHRWFAGRGQVPPFSPPFSPSPTSVRAGDSARLLPQECSRLRS